MSDSPHVTIVLDINRSDVERLRTMINAYGPDLPTELGAVLKDIRRQLPHVEGVR